MERGSGRYKTMERKNRKSGSTILYLTFIPVQQGTRRKSSFCYSDYNKIRYDIKEKSEGKIKKHTGETSTKVNIKI